MSEGSLKEIISGGRLSDNALGRIRSSLLTEITENAKKLVPGDRRRATPSKVAAAIGDVSNKLVFFEKIIEGSSSLASEDSLIDEIQIRQLIALLSATLEALRASLIDKKQTSGFFRWLRNVTKVSVQRGVEKVVTDAMGDAVDASNTLIHHSQIMAAYQTLEILLLRVYLSFLPSLPVRKHHS